MIEFKFLIVLNKWNLTRILFGNLVVSLISTLLICLPMLIYAISIDVIFYRVDGVLVVIFV